MLAHAAAFLFHDMLVVSAGARRCARGSGCQSAHIAACQQNGATAMSEQTRAADGRAATLAALDAARDRFLAAFAQAPDEALPFVPAGAETPLGAVPLHMQAPIRDHT